MASYSAKYKQLSKRISLIETNYLPAIKPRGNYTDKEQDDMRSYSFLVHAEIEFYFEEIARGTIIRALNRWKKDHNNKSHILLSLVCFCKETLTTPDITTRIHQACHYYEKVLKKNNGIKEANILNILLPIGIEKVDIDITWLNTLSAFGETRGNIAHSTARVQNSLDPLSLKTTVNLILSEIQGIDKKIQKLK